MDQIRDIAARFNEPLAPPSLNDLLRGGAILAKWESMGGENSPLGAPKSLEAAGEGSARYATFDKGAVYWSPESGAEPITGAIYDAWASLGYERGALGLPTSGEIQEPQWIVQNFQHGTLNFDREKGTVTRVIDGVPEELPPPSADGPPVQLERIKPIDPELNYSHQRSSTRATPSSVLGAVTSSAASIASGCALPIATPRPAHRSSGTSLGMSPNATTSSAVISYGRATSSTPVALLMPSGTTSIRPLFGGVGDITLQTNMFGEFGRHVGTARTGLADQQLDRRVR